MPMRLSGLVTGMDTEAIVAQMMSAQSIKKNRVVQAKTKLEWKQDAWKDMNKKLTTFYNTYASKLRLPSTYKVKKANVSDTSKATVSADAGAVTGNYTLEVKDIASAQFLTSAKTDITSTSQKFGELDSLKGMIGEKISVTGSKGTKELAITADTKVSDFVKTLQDAGLNANYDTTQKKFFISSKSTGADNAFSITATGASTEETSKLNSLKESIASAAGADSFSELYAGLDDEKKQAVDSAIKALTSDEASDDGFVTARANQIALALDISDPDKIESIKTAASEYAAVSDRTASSGALSALGLANVEADENGKLTVDGVAFNDGDKFESGMALIGAKNSRVILNGAELTSASSTVSANGLNINLVSETKEGEVVNFSVNNDIDAVYDTVKKALSEYNELMKEISTKLNADSSKGYEPLTSDQKKAMSDDEVEEWEKKIKDSLLRNDQTLSSVQSSMREALMSSVKVGDNTYSLSSFGIMTSKNYREGGLLHIYGDPDDSEYADKEDKLKKALIENPDEAIEVLTGIFEKLRSTMFDKMGASEYSSALTFYNDKQMEKDMSSYKTQIKTWEDKLADMEDSYYKKFAAMETAMQKLQSQSSSVLGLFGNN